MSLFDVIEAGHFQKTVGEGPDKGQLVCRADGQTWPCAMVLAARVEGEKQRKADRGTKKFKPTPNESRSHY